MENRPQDIRPCIYCYTCVSQIFINQRVKCAVNPLTGHESELQITPAPTPTHVVVVGGGGVSEAGAGVGGDFVEGERGREYPPGAVFAG